MPSSAAQKYDRHPTEREVAALDLISEQGAIPIDQLARFLRVKRSEARRIAEELRAIGCVETKRLIEGDEPWIWLTARGARFSTTGLGAVEPAINRLAHTRAISEGTAPRHRAPRSRGAVDLRKGPEARTPHRG